MHNQFLITTFYVVSIILFVWPSGDIHAQELYADSLLEWSGAGVQGESNWFSGFYNLTQDPDGTYQPADFMPFSNACGPGGTECPDGGTVSIDGNHWKGPVPASPAEPGDEPRWDLTEGYSPPWTRLGRETLHPNGVNSGDEHWVMRRWVCDTDLGDATVTWELRKQSSGGSGVTGRIFLSRAGENVAQELDADLVAGDDLAGFSRTVETYLNTGDIIALAVTPVGTDDLSHSAGDGSFYRLRIFAGALDSDEDGVPDNRDNCPSTPNADQQNSDNDAHGDACDNCPDTDNEAQGDHDRDGIGNLCDDDFPGADRPNIVFIMIDDSGIGDFPCYVPSSPVLTPNVDMLAEGGMLFTRAYAGCTVCAPSRSVVMTGYHMGHTSVRGNFNTASIQDRDITIPEVLQGAGYSSGGYGKWGLASPGTIGVPERQGFDDFLGYYNQVHAHTYYVDRLYRNGEIYSIPENAGFSEPGTGLVASQRVHSHFVAVDAMKQFISQRAQAGVPFFAYGTWTPPHTHSVIPEDDPAWDLYEDESWSVGQKIQAAMISIIDRHVGEVMDVLRDPDGDGDQADSVLENTLIVFTSDNGGTSNTAHARNGILRGHKTSMYEGGLRVPLIAYWPGRIAAGTTSDLITYFPDLMPTFAEVAGAEEFVPQDTDGISILPTLLGEGEQEQHDGIYFEYYGHEAPNIVPIKAARMGDWKLILKSNGGTELYNLRTDPRESSNVSSSNPDKVTQLRNFINAEHVPLRPQYNVSPPSPGNAGKDGIITFGVRPGHEVRSWTLAEMGDAKSLSGQVRDDRGDPVRLYMDDLDEYYALGLEISRHTSSAPALSIAVKGRSGFGYFSARVLTSQVPMGSSANVLARLEAASSTPSASQLSGDRNNPLTLEVTHGGDLGDVSAKILFMDGECIEHGGDCGIACDGSWIIPAELAFLQPGCGPRFKRSDCNDDGQTDLSDAVKTLTWLFSDDSFVSCVSACDANDDGGIDLADAIFTLSYLFGNDSEPPSAPFAGCGEDPTEDMLTCEEFTSCNE